MKNLAGRPAPTASVPTARARRVLPRPALPWKTRPPSVALGEGRRAWRARWPCASARAGPSRARSWSWPTWPRRAWRRRGTRPRSRCRASSCGRWRGRRRAARPWPSSPSAHPHRGVVDREGRRPRRTRPSRTVRAPAPRPRPPRRRAPWRPAPPGRTRRTGPGGGVSTRGGAAPRASPYAPAGRRAGPP